MNVEQAFELLKGMDQAELDNLWEMLELEGLLILGISPGLAVTLGKERGGSDYLRKVACKDPACAYQYAIDVDHGPHEATREGALESPWQALCYAALVDHGPREDTRTAASQSPREAFRYAQEVDEGPHDVTRAGACKDPGAAFNYAVSIEGSHPDTWQAVQGTYFEKLYRKRLGVESEVEP